MAKIIEEAVKSPLEEYRRAVAANPQSAEAQSNLGWGYYGADQWEAATQAFTEALRLDPGHIDAHYGLALTRKGAGAKAEAIASFKNALAQVATLEDQTRGHVLRRLAYGQINFIQSGGWKMVNVLGSDA